MLKVGPQRPKSGKFPKFFENFIWKSSLRGKHSRYESPALVVLYADCTGIWYILSG